MSDLFSVSLMPSVVIGMKSAISDSYLIDSTFFR